MLKSVVASNQVASQVATFCDNDEDSPDFSYGLATGHVASGGKELHLVHLARTPIEGDDDCADIKEPVSSLDEIDPEWLGEHAKQVLSMLPGGIEVLGLFIASDKNVLGSKPSMTKLMKAVEHVERAASLDRKHSDKFIIAHLDRRSASVKCEAVVSKKEAKTRRVDYSEPSDDLAWLCVKSNLILDESFAFPTTSTDGPIKQKLDVSLNILDKSLQTASLLINGRFRGEADEPLDVSAIANSITSSSAKSKGKGKGGKKGRETSSTMATSTNTEASGDEVGRSRKGKLKEFEVDILLDEVDQLGEDCKVAEAASKMHIIGRLSTRAYLSSGATVGEAVAALRTDILRTLNARFEMHCDSLVGEEMRGADDSLPILHEPPRRVNIKLPGSDVTISDFLFPGETPDESVKGVEEMFGFIPTFETMDDELEIVASPKTVVVRMTYIYDRLLFTFDSVFRWEKTPSPGRRVRCF